MSAREIMFDAFDAFVKTITDTVINTIAQNRLWAGPVVFALAFAESLAVISLAVPFTAMIIGAGALLCSPTAALDPVPLLAWGIAGAAVGDAVSYWVGRLLKERVRHIWPFRQDPAPLDRGYRFFERWGVVSVFIGRFLGPLRAVVPLVAGILRMPQAKFQIANVVSAIIWLPIIMYSGCAIGKILGLALDDANKMGERVFGYVFVFFLAASIIGALIAFVNRRRRKAPDSVSE
jgi:membrane protein DedA with SNARE-associated domain